MTSHFMRCTVDIVQLPERTEKATYLLRADAGWGWAPSSIEPRSHRLPTEIVVFKTLPT